MPRPSPLTYLPLWTRAFDFEIGYRFTVANIDREQFRTLLYKARELSKDPTLQELIMFAPAAPYDNEIWICRKSVELEP
jgi:hypothetical protein